MINNEKQYRVTQDRAMSFAQLVEHLESGEAQSIPSEVPALRQAKLDAARSVLQELREELQEWESKHRSDAPQSDKPPLPSSRDRFSSALCSTSRCGWKPRVPTARIPGTSAW